MGLSWKDLVATILAAATIGTYYINTKGISFPLISNNRGAVLVLAIIGIIMCATGARVTNGFGSSPLIIFLTILGALSLVLIIAGLITGNKMVLTSLTAVMILLWLITTIRHIFVK